MRPYDSIRPGETHQGSGSAEPISDWKAEYDEIASLAGGFAHEIRNPLSSILLNVELLSEELVDAESPRDRRMATKLSRVQGEVQYLENVVEAFLEFARSSRAETAQADLNAVVLRSLEDFEPEAAAAAIELSPHLETDLPPVALDASLFRQVLSNLTRNARQAMPEGGTLEVSTRRVNSNVIVEVIDTGCGMTPEQRSRMFEAFYSTKSHRKGGGTGLGLPTVRKIVEAHGGQIECESEVDRGTRFRMTLPLASESA